MKKYYIKDIVITNIKREAYLKSQYQTNYIISINNDIIDFTKTLKEAKRKAIDFIKEKEAQNNE